MKHNLTFNILTSLCSVNILILSGIPDAQTKMSVSKRGCHVISIGISDTAAKIHCTLLPLLIHYKDMLACCKQEFRMAGLLIDLAGVFLIMKHNFTFNILTSLCSVNIFILSGIPDAQTKMSVSKRGCHVISIGISDTAAKIHCTLLPLLIHYKDMLACCKQEFRMAGVLIDLSGVFNNGT